jgi:hypothetical protein
VTPFLPAGALVGLLADEDRRRVVAALTLGAGSFEEVARTAELDLPRTARAVGRLVDAGLVERAGDGSLQLLAQAFAVAARAAAEQARATEAAAAEPVGADVPPDVAKVLRAFVRGGRLQSIPTARNKRLVVLDRLAQEFEPGRRYREDTVNVVLARWHPDTAALRRYLVDEGFLDRDAGEYWRTGGTVRVGRP